MTVGARLLLIPPGNRQDEPFEGAFMSLPSVTVRRLRSTAIVVVFFTLASANTAIAQELSAIIGQVRDESGADPARCDGVGSSPVLQLKK
jgi:hypothetical protein